MVLRSSANGEFNLIHERLVAEPILISSSDLKAKLRRWPVECTNFLPIDKDAVYCLVPKDWFPKFAQWCKDNPVSYVPSAYDCDDIALQTVADAARTMDYTGKAKAFLWCEITITPTGNYFDNQVQFNENAHGTCLIAADDGELYIFERTVQRYENLAKLLSDFAVTTVEFVLV